MVTRSTQTAAIISARRYGYTLLELVLSLGSASILLAGLATCLFVSQAALKPTGIAKNRSDIHTIQQQVTRDFSQAVRILEKTPNAATIRVPDRNGDGKPEKLRYSWSGTPGDPLYYQLNNRAPAILAASVEDFQLSYTTRLIAGNGSGAINMIEPVKFLEYTDGTNKTGNNMQVNFPASATPGTFLVAFAAVHGNQTSTLGVDSNTWTLYDKRNNGSNICYGIWYQFYEGDEPSSFLFTGLNSEAAYGFVMVFSGVDPVSPLGNYEYLTGSSSDPSVPEVSTTIENSLVLRLGAFQDDRANNGSTGIGKNHTDITMVNVNSDTDCSGGAAFIIQEEMGPAGAVNFKLKSSEHFVTASMVLQPVVNP